MLKLPRGVFTIGDLDFDELFKELTRRERLRKECADSLSTNRKWATLRRVYAELLPDILESARESRRGGIDPYFADWIKYFTPIEFDAWQSIRCKGIPLYPQYPVLRYFLDFANPYHKIGIEMDGKDFHDKVKDKARDLDLAKAGWSIFRITGSECYVEYKSLPDIDEMEQDEQHEHLQHWILNSSDGVFEAVKLIYFTAKERARASRLYDIAWESLNRHRLIDFDIPYLYFDED